MVMKSLHYERKKVESAPPEIQEWYEGAKGKHQQMIKKLQDHLYILVSGGEKTTGGHHVEIDKIEQIDRHECHIHYKIYEPTDETTTISSFAYPYDLVVLPISQFEKDDQGQQEEFFHFVLSKDRH